MEERLFRCYDFYYHFSFGRDFYPLCWENTGKAVPPSLRPPPIVTPEEIDARRKKWKP